MAVGQASLAVQKRIDPVHITIDFGDHCKRWIVRVGTAHTYDAHNEALSILN